MMYGNNDRAGSWAQVGWEQQQTAATPGYQPAHYYPEQGYPQDAFLFTGPIVQGAPDPHQLEEAETEKITMDEPNAAYDAARERYEAHKNDPPMLLGDFAPPVWTSLEGSNTPPWNRFDTFLRRGVMVAAFVLLWTMIVVGILAGAAVMRAVDNLSDPAVSSYEDGTSIPPGVDLFPTCDPTGSNPDLPAC